jgi:hypothetical protein
LLLWSMCTFSIEPWNINVTTEDWVFSLNLMSRGKFSCEISCQV